jgi:hypothetical protein
MDKSKKEKPILKMKTTYYEQKSLKVFHKTDSIQSIKQIAVATYSKAVFCKNKI